jgi:hypothetical protein
VIRAGTNATESGTVTEARTRTTEAAAGRLLREAIEEAVPLHCPVSTTLDNWHIKGDGCVHVHASYADGGQTSKVRECSGRQVITESGSTYVLGVLDPKIAAVLACISWLHDETDPLNATSAQHLLHAEKLVYGSARNAARLALLAVANLRDVLALPDADGAFRRIDEQFHSLGIGAALLSHNW